MTSKIERLDLSQSIKIGNVSITGNVGSGVVIHEGNTVARNIAGGDISDNVFVSDDNESPNFVETMNAYIDEHKIDESLKEAVELINAQIENKDSTDESLLAYLLRSTFRKSPDLYQEIVKRISSQENISPHVYRLARSNLQSQKK